MTDNEIRAAWRKAGGSFHGPIVETATMPETEMLGFVRRMVDAEREACAKVCEATGPELIRWWGDGQANAAAKECADAIRRTG